MNNFKIPPRVQPSIATPRPTQPIDIKNPYRRDDYGSYADAIKIINLLTNEDKNNDK